MTQDGDDPRQLEMAFEFLTSQGLVTEAELALAQLRKSPAAFEALAPSSYSETLRVYEQAIALGK